MQQTIVSSVAPATDAPAPVAADSASAPRTFRIPVSTALFEDCAKLGSAIWLLLHYIDRTTEEVPQPGGTLIGRVLGGKPVCDAEAAARLHCSVKTIRRWRRTLERAGHIRRRRTPFGAVIEVVNSQKWLGRRDKSVPSESPRTARPVDRNIASQRTGTGRPVAKSVHGSGQEWAIQRRQYRDSTEQYRDRPAANAAFSNPVPGNLLALAKAEPASQEDEPTPEQRKEMVRKIRAELEAALGCKLSVEEPPCRPPRRF